MRVTLPQVPGAISSQIRCATLPPGPVIRSPRSDATHAPEGIPKSRDMAPRTSAGTRPPCHAGFSKRRQAGSSNISMHFATPLARWSSVKIRWPMGSGSRPAPATSMPGPVQSIAAELNSSPKRASRVRATTRSIAADSWSSAASGASRGACEPGTGSAGSSPGGRSSNSASTSATASMMALGCFWKTRGETAMRLRCTASQSDHDSRVSYL